MHRKQASGGCGPGEAARYAMDGGPVRTSTNLDASDENNENNDS